MLSSLVMSNFSLGELLAAATHRAPRRPANLLHVRVEALLRALECEALGVGLRCFV